MKNIIDFVSKDEIIKLTADLVAIQSYSGLENQEAQIGHYIKKVFDAEGIECQYIPLKNGRCNVVAKLSGAGGGKSLLLNGHLDTVPAYDMEKAFEPWLDEEGNLHGRGTADMKGPIAAMMSTLIALKRSGTVLNGDLFFAGVADEEEGSLGCINLIESGFRADAAIIGEPLGKTSLGISQKGLEWYQLDFIGKTVHGGSYREGKNAILMAVKFIEEIRDNLAPKIAQRIHPIAGESTLNMGVIHGGTQLSTVAGDCYIQMDRRFLPEIETYEGCNQELQDVIDKLSAQDPDFKCELKVLDVSVMEKGYVHQGFVQQDDEPITKALISAVEGTLKEPAALIPCPFWTDGGLLAHYAKMPVVVYGPGNIECCHSVREYINTQDLYEGYQVYVNTALDFCGLAGGHVVYGFESLLTSH